MEKRVQGIAKDSILLQQYLKSELGLTRRQISGAKFRAEGILVNGKQCRVSERIRPGDVVSVLLEDDSVCSEQLLPLKQELEVLYEDEDLLAVNKPAGMVVHPSHGHYQDTLSNAVSAYFAGKGEQVKIRSIGRLDKETSGIVLFAKNQAAAGRLALQKEQGSFRKRYLALTEGIPVPAQGTITTPITRDETTLMKMKTSDQGMRAVTHYQVLQSTAVASLISVTLETGRTHQIRVHMASIGHPLLGDNLYGHPTAELTRAALHAESCRFLQPFTQQEITIRAPLPDDIKSVTQKSLAAPTRRC
jgi:23S rRNA pseudouridine1911/1915/1917 synthase